VPLIRRKPLVFVSSAIVGLEEVRQRIHERVTSLGVAEDWLFEIHATSGGEPAEVQYVDIARSCDLMLLIVGDRRSRATEDEYREAFTDNPDKILPVYLGPKNNDVGAFRTLIDSRHSRVQVASEGELIEQAVAGIARAARNGRVIITAIRDDFAQRLAGLDRLLDVSPPRVYPPFLSVGLSEVNHATAMADSPQLAIVGVGGSGKTYGALVELYRLSYARTEPDTPGGRKRTQLDLVIPLYLRAGVEAHTVDLLIERAFSAARFFPGPELTREYAREGRLALAVDGYDDLPAAARTELLQSIEGWSQAYPRCRVMVLARQLPDGVLQMFGQASPAPLSEAQIVELFQANGQGIRGMIDVPPELADLVGWPFWASAIARFGLEVKSGLDLLQRTIRHRVGLATPGEAVRAQKAEAALGELARASYPEIVISQPDSVARLDTWQSVGAGARFEPEPAERLLELLRSTGLVNREGDAVAFVHPLITATLAAQTLAADPPIDKYRLVDDELSAFTAALLGDEAYNDLVEILAARDIFFLARVVRLSPVAGRDTDLEADLSRYEHALRRLADLAGPIAGRPLSELHVAAAAEETWLALRFVDGDSCVAGTYAEFLSLPGPEEVCLWQGTPFSTRTPERVAAAEVLWRFKREFDALTRTEPRFPGENGEPLPRGSALETAVIERARNVRNEEQLLRDEAGLGATQALPRLDGEPKVTVQSESYGAFVSVEWGFDGAEVHFEADAKSDRAQGQIRSFLNGSALDDAKGQLRRRAEREIGSNMGSGAWNRPSALAGWVW
jgi:hypothetical protein